MRSQTKLCELERNLFDTCIIFTRLDELGNLKNILAVTKKIIKEKWKSNDLNPNEKITILALIYDFPAEFAHKMKSIIDVQYHISQSRLFTIL